MKFLRIVMATLLAGVLFGGQAATPSLAATKSKSKQTSVLSKMATGTKNFVSNLGNLFSAKKTTSKKKTSK